MTGISDPSLCVDIIELNDTQRSDCNIFLLQLRNCDKRKSKTPLGEVFRERHTGGSLGDDPGHAGESMSLREEPGKVTWEREVWASLLL